MPVRSASSICPADRSEVPTLASSATLRSCTRARFARRPSVSSTLSDPTIESSNSWASSMTSRVCSGSSVRPVWMWAPYRCALTTTTSASSAAARACSDQQSSANEQLAAPTHSPGPTDTGAPRLPVGGVLQLGEVTAVGGLGPVDEPLDLGQDLLVGQVGPRRGAVGTELEVLLLGAASQLHADLVERSGAEVVGAALQHGVAERPVEGPGEERQVDLGQLVLEGLGRRDHHGAVVGPGGSDGGQQVGERLADARRALHREVALGAERGLHRAGHLDLGRSVLSSGDRRRDLLQQVDGVGAVRSGHL